MRDKLLTLAAAMDSIEEGQYKKKMYCFPVTAPTPMHDGGCLGANAAEERAVLQSKGTCDGTAAHKPGINSLLHPQHSAHIPLALQKESPRLTFRYSSFDQLHPAMPLIPTAGAFPAMGSHIITDANASHLSIWNVTVAETISVPPTWTHRASASAAATRCHSRPHPPSGSPAWAPYGVHLSPPSAAPQPPYGYGKSPRISHTGTAGGLPPYGPQYRLSGAPQPYYPRLAPYRAHQGPIAPGPCSPLVASMTVQPPASASPTGGVAPAHVTTSAAWDAAAFMYQPHCLVNIPTSPLEEVAESQGPPQEPHQAAVVRKTTPRKTATGKAAMGRAVTGKTAKAKVAVRKTAVRKTVAGKVAIGKKCTGRTASGRTKSGKTKSFMMAEDFVEGRFAVDSTHVHLTSRPGGGRGGPSVLTQPVDFDSKVTQNIPATISPAALPAISGAKGSGLPYSEGAEAVGASPADNLPGVCSAQQDSQGASREVDLGSRTAIEELQRSPTGPSTGFQTPLPNLYPNLSTVFARQDAQLQLQSPTTVQQQPLPLTWGPCTCPECISMERCGCHACMMKAAMPRQAAVRLVPVLRAPTSGRFATLAAHPQYCSPYFGGSPIQLSQLHPEKGLAPSPASPRLQQLRQQQEMQQQQQQAKCKCSLCGSCNIPSVCDGSGIVDGVNGVGGSHLPRGHGTGTGTSFPVRSDPRVIACRYSPYSYWSPVKALYPCYQYPCRCASACLPHTAYRREMSGYPYRAVYDNVYNQQVSAVYERRAAQPYACMLRGDASSGLARPMSHSDAAAPYSELGNVIMRGVPLHLLQHQKLAQQPSTPSPMPQVQQQEKEQQEKQEEQQQQLLQQAARVAGTRAACGKAIPLANNGHQTLLRPRRPQPPTPSTPPTSSPSQHYQQLQQHVQNPLPRPTAQDAHEKMADAGCSASPQSAGPSPLDALWDGAVADRLEQYGCAKALAEAMYQESVAAAASAAKITTANVAAATNTAKVATTNAAKVATIKKVVNAEAEAAAVSAAPAAVASCAAAAMAHRPPGARVAAPPPKEALPTERNPRITAPMNAVRTAAAGRSQPDVAATRRRSRDEMEQGDAMHGSGPAQSLRPSPRPSQQPLQSAHAIGAPGTPTLGALLALAEADGLAGRPAKRALVGMLARLHELESFF